MGISFFGLIIVVGLAVIFGLVKGISAMLGLFKSCKGATRCSLVQRVASRRLTPMAVVMRAVPSCDLQPSAVAPRQEIGVPCSNNKDLLEPLNFIPIGLPVMKRQGYECVSCPA